MKPSSSPGPAALMAGDIGAMEVLARTLVLSGLGMTICGGSYPASQGEHLISHYIDMLGDPAWPASFHGEHIAVTTLTMARHPGGDARGRSARGRGHAGSDRADVDRAISGPSSAPPAGPPSPRRRSMPDAAAALQGRLARSWPEIRRRIGAGHAAAGGDRSGAEGRGRADDDAADIHVPEGFYREAVVHARRDPRSLWLPRSRRRFRPASRLRRRGMSGMLRPSRANFPAPSARGVARRDDRYRRYPDRAWPPAGGELRGHGAPACRRAYRHPRDRTAGGLVRPDRPAMAGRRRGRRERRPLFPLPRWREADAARAMPGTRRRARRTASALGRIGKEMLAEVPGAAVRPTRPIGKPISPSTTARTCRALSAGCGRSASSQCSSAMAPRPKSAPSMSTAGSAATTSFP